MATRVLYEYRRPGKPPTYYDEWLVLDQPDVKVLLLDPYEGKRVVVDGVTVLEPGAPIVWYVFPDRWYDIGRFHLADGRPTGWYTNLCRPPVISGHRWIGNDLFLDLWQPMTGGHRWLDEDELEEAIRAGYVDSATRRRVANERALIDLQLARGNWPPRVARDVDLPNARALLET